MSMWLTDRCIPLALAGLAALAGPSAAQTLQDEIVNDLRGVQEKIAALAAEVPVEHYTHRVHADVRSIGEEFMHVASANFRFPRMLGIDPPDVPQDWVQGNAEGLDSDTAVRAVNDSFEFMIGVVQGIEDLDREMSVFGRSTNVRGFLVVMTSHLHEHLGKLISDSRSVGVVPPWSG